MTCLCMSKDMTHRMQYYSHFTSPYAVLLLELSLSSHKGAEHPCDCERPWRPRWSFGERKAGDSDIALGQDVFSEPPAVRIFERRTSPVLFTAAHVIDLAAATRPTIGIGASIYYSLTR